MASQAQNPYITISDRILHCNDNPLTIFIDFRTLTLLHDASIKVTAPGKFDRYTDRRGSIALDTPLLHYTRKEILTARLHRYTNRTDNDRFHSWRIDLYRGHHRAPNRGHTDDHILELEIPRDAEEVAAEVEYRDGDTAATETRRVFPLRSRNLRFFTPRDRFLGYDVRASFEDPAVEVAGAHRSFFEYDVHSAATTIRLDFGPGCDFRLMKTSKRDEFVGRAPRGTRLDWVMVVVTTLVLRDRYLERSGIGQPERSTDTAWERLRVRTERRGRGRPRVGDVEEGEEVTGRLRPRSRERSE